jgi:hypothetical protein
MTGSIFAGLEMGRLVSRASGPFWSFHPYIERLGVLLPGMWCISFVTQKKGKETLILQQTRHEARNIGNAAVAVEAKLLMAG